MEPRAFVLRVLLLLCGDKESVWEKILPLSTRNFELPDDCDLQPGEAVDGIDNGVSVAGDEEPRYRVTTDLSARAGRLNPEWHEAADDANEAFRSAVLLTG
jgi:hypothetical protein